MEPLSPADQLILFCTLPSGAFTLYYGLFVRWYKTLLGWAVFILSLSLSCVLGLVTFSVTVGERAPEWVRVVVYAGVFFGLTAKLVVLVFEQHQGRIERRRRKGSPSDQHDPRAADTGELTLR